jgi:hypothetical protein
MSFKKFSPRSVVLLLIIMVVATLRLTSLFTDHLSSFSNFTPIGAMALFGGASFKGKFKPFVFPLFTLFISDMILSFTVYAEFRSGLLYGGWYWTYAAFALMVVAGKLLVNNVTVKNVCLSVIVITIIHWLVSDIGGCLREQSTEAMLSLYGQRLVTAIPYELNFLIGSLVYGGLMFGSFEWMQRRHPGIRPGSKQKSLAS